MFGLGRGRSWATRRAERSAKKASKDQAAATAAFQTAMAGGGGGASNAANRDALMRGSGAQGMGRQVVPDGASTADTIRAQQDEQDLGLEEVSGVLADLKDMSLAMGATIDSQTQQLGNIKDGVDSANARMKNDNRRIKKLLT